MRKVAFVFIVAIVAPSLLLGWLAIRSLRDQQLVFERQESLLGQGAADAIANDLLGELAAWQRGFGRQVEEALGKGEPADLAPRFDAVLRERWTNAVVGFVVALDGDVLSPSLFGSADARRFRLENDRFLCSRQSMEVVWNSPKGKINLTELDSKLRDADSKSVFATKNVSGSDGTVAPSSAQFREIVGDAAEGTLARFLQNQLRLLLWHRSARDTNLVFGAEVHLGHLGESLRPLVRVDTALNEQLVALLRDDRGRTVAASRSDVVLNGQRALGSAALGDALPHWEIAVFLRGPSQAIRSAATARTTIGLLVTLLILAIGVGSLLIVADLRRQLLLARQKTDFVSNVSHELKTPLTSIRMFAEMLAEGRVAEPEKQRRFLDIISTEAARLTRLINNVLDFARRERGEERQLFILCDLAEITQEAVNSYRLHLESAGFTLACELPGRPVTVNGDRDALAQVLVNLIANAEKYCGLQKQITVRLISQDRCAQLQVLDRGLGVPGGSEERIFEQFFRAHDALASGIPGSGLGLTLARQIARAHGGELTYAPRDGGGSVFTLRTPSASSTAPDPTQKPRPIG